MQGNADEMAVALFESGLLPGILRRLERAWPSFPHEDVEDIVAETAWRLYSAVRAGTPVNSLPAWVIKVADRLAKRRWSTAARLDPIGPEPEDGRYGGLGEPDEEDQLRAAVARVRRLLPRIQGHTVQSVLAYLLDAIEAGHENIPAGEIASALGLSEGAVRTSLSRGRRKLLRLMLDDGALARSSRVVARFLPEEAEQELCEEDQC